jgi:hypothetical protein
LTGLNEAFVIDKTTRDAFVKSEPKSAELLKPFLIGKEIKKWRVESRDLFCILIPKGWTKKHIETNDENQAWQWFYKTYPAIAKHLEPFTKKARKRTDKGDFWWELRACTYYGEFEKQKIIYGHFQDVPLFSIAEKSVYCNNKAYISANMGFYELGLLNSKLIWFSFSQQTTRMRGGFFEATTQNINNIPIPNATETQKQDIAKIAEACQAVAESRYQKQDAVRRRIPDLCPPEREAKLNAKLKNWWQLDFANFRAEIKKAFKQDIPLSERNEWEHWLNQERAEIAQLSAELAALEKALNEKVYALFELTEEEIRLVEENQ